MRFTIIRTFLANAGLAAIAALVACGGGAEPTVVTPPSTSSCTAALPNLTYASSYSANIGTAVAILPSSFSNMPSGCTATLTATGLPTGLSININTGAISGTAAIAGTSTVTVTYAVRNTAGVSIPTWPSTSTFAITVNPTMVAMTNTQLLAIKSANTASWALSAVDGMLGYGYSYLSANLPLMGTAATMQGVKVCTTGSYLATWNVASSTAYTVGDAISLTYTNCLKSNGRTYNGTDSYRVTSFKSGELTIRASLSGVLLGSSNSSATFAADTMTLTRTASSTGGYPIRYVTTGSVRATITTTASNIASGTYTLSNANYYTNLRFMPSPTFSYPVSRWGTYASTDGIYTVDVSNSAPLTTTSSSPSGSGSTVSSYPIYEVSFAGAKLTSTTNSPTSTTLSGINAGGGSITPTNIPMAYFY